MYNFDNREILRNLYDKLEKIKSSKKDLRVTVLPDFFIDRVIQISDPSNFIKDVEKKIVVGGGSIRGLPSLEIKGGNAVNVAYGLAKLGINIDLFTVADEIGAAVLHSVFQPFQSNAHIHIKKGRHGLTTVFEFSSSIFTPTFPPSTPSTPSPSPMSLSSTVSSNVMISDVGDNDNFDSGIIDSPETLYILKKSDAVVLTNWASNFMATNLMQYVFSNSPRSIHFIDPADIEKRCFEFINDLKKNSHLIDFLSVNENEYDQIISAINSIIETNHDKKNGYTMLKKMHPLNPKLFCHSVQTLSTFLKVNVCVHTVEGSAFSDGFRSFFVNSIPPSCINILSGAGDSWDSAFLFGHLYEFSLVEKLCFANLVASLYVEDLYDGFPSLSDLVNYIQSKYL